MAGPKAVTIIVPVYADWPSLKNCIESLIEHVSDKNRVMLVNDCGPEADMLEQNIKSAINGQKIFTYYRNPKNLGFVKTCNRAVMELDKTSNDILLLNSDTKVTAGFLQEMEDVMESNAKIGTVSPRTNNATLATVPLRTAHQKGIDPNESYAIFLKIKDKLPRLQEVPVAHGYCMLIRRSLIKKYGLFDEVFGKGYGEEVDFCRRIKKHGFISVLSNRAYVFHMEARSFTHATKAKLLEENNKILWERYPEYRQEVRDYMQQAIAEESKIEEKAGIKISHRQRARSYAGKLKRKLLR